MENDMSEQHERYQWVAAQFGARVDQVAADAWDNPAPVEGWVARDVVGHLVEWLPAFFFGTWGIDAGPAPDAATDPVAAWRWLDDAIQGALDDPAVAEAVRDTHMGTSSFEQQISMIATTDVLIHTWDLARATGLDEQLDAEGVRSYVEGMEPLDQILRQSGHYGPRVAVDEDADDQTRLLAFLGRQP